MKAEIPAAHPALVDDAPTKDPNITVTVPPSPPKPSCAEENTSKTTIISKYRENLPAINKANISEENKSVNLDPLNTIPPDKSSQILHGVQKLPAKKRLFYPNKRGSSSVNPFRAQNINKNEVYAARRRKRFEPVSGKNVVDYGRWRNKSYILSSQSSCIQY